MCVNVCVLTCVYLYVAVLWVGIFRIYSKGLIASNQLHPQISYKIDKFPSIIINLYRFKHRMSEGMGFENDGMAKY